MILAFILIIFKGSSEGPKIIFSNLITTYVDETAAAVVTDPSQNQLADINSLTSLNNNDPNQGGESTDTVNLSIVQENSVQASNPASTDYIDGFKANQVITYTVQPGDTIGSIAANFDDSVNTIIWANNIKNPNVLSLGQVLKIPPVSGVIHTVQTGDTIVSIAKKYKADSQKILSFNNLRDDNSLIVGNELMVPDGELPGPKPSYIAKSVTVGSQIYVSTRDGQCVSFVQAHGFSNLRGNAKDWVRYINTSNPRVGGVIIFIGGGYGRHGHIALITAIKEDRIQVVEQNFFGPRIVDHREISLSDRTIVGFIQ